MSNRIKIWNFLNKKIVKNKQDWFETWLILLFKFFYYFDLKRLCLKKTLIEAFREKCKNNILIGFQFANDTDAGEYVCEVSSNPPATLRHHVSLIGKEPFMLMEQE